MAGIEARRVLITGGAGFIGSHLVDRFLATGAAVTVLDDFSTGLSDNLPASERLRVIPGCILDERALAMAAEDCDLVLHLASVVGMRRAYSNPAYAMKVSEEGTAKVLAASKNVPILLMSSSAVYGLDPDTEAIEENPLSEESVRAYDGHRPGYACGKAALERLGAAAIARGRRVIMVRPFNVIGPRQRDAFGMVLPNLVRQALANEPLEIHGDGLQTRSFGDARTFVDCLMRLLSMSEAWQPQNTPINLGNARETTMLDLAEMVIEETAADSGIRLVPYEQIFPGKHDVRRRRPDLARLHRLLGPVEWASLRSIVRDFCRTASRPNGLFTNELLPDAREP
jgi:UDP-glucose 4-epimerase